MAYELAKQLAPFTKDGVYGDFFNGRANISLDADMVGLELEELKNAPELRRVVLFVLTSRIAHLVVIDVLAMGVAMARGPSLVNHLKSVKRSLRSLRLSPKSVKALDD